jgi:hypothetical protein
MSETHDVATDPSDEPEPACYVQANQSDHWWMTKSWAVVQRMQLRPCGHERCFDGAQPDLEADDELVVRSGSSRIVYHVPE